MRWCAIGMSIVLTAGCFSSGSLVGIVSTDAFSSRILRISNESRQYVVVRVTAPGAEPLVTSTLCPGGEVYREMLMQFGSLCPESLRVDIAAYSRAHPEQSPLDDESLIAEPFAAVAIQLAATRDYGCQADPSLVSLDSLIDCTILDADLETGAIGVQVGFLPPQRLVGVQIADVPAPVPPETFALRGDVVDISGQPMPNVEIHLPQLETSVFTDADGRFSIMRPAGSYVVRPVLLGVEFSPVLQEFTHFSSDEVPVEFIAQVGG